MLIRTTSLIYDDRVRKEAVSLSKMDSVNVMICAFENKSPPFSLSNVSIFRKKIRLRKYFSSNKLLIAKLLEMYLTFIFCVKKTNPDLVWLHNFESVGLIPCFAFLNIFRKKKIKVIWDQHEMPPEFFYSNWVGKYFYKTLVKMASGNVMATDSRIDFLRESCAIETKIFCLENLPDEVFVNHKSNELKSEVVSWLNGDDFFLCQGGYSITRGFSEVAKAFISAKKKIVFVGAKKQTLIDCLVHDCLKEEVGKYCLFLDSVPQIELTDFIDKAIGSVIFYKKSNINNWLCAPNRFYQSLARSTPVLTGNNPIFVNAIKDSFSGVIAQTDGSLEKEIKKSILFFVENKESFIVDSSYVWESQESIIIELVQSTI